MSVGAASPQRDSIVMVNAEVLNQVVKLAAISLENKYAKEGRSHQQYENDLYELLLTSNVEAPSENNQCLVENLPESDMLQAESPCLSQIGKLGSALLLSASERRTDVNMSNASIASTRESNIGHVETPVALAMPNSPPRQSRQVFEPDIVFVSAMETETLRRKNVKRPASASTLHSEDIGFLINTSDSSISWTSKQSLNTTLTRSPVLEEGSSSESITPLVPSTSHGESDNYGPPRKKTKLMSPTRDENGGVQHPWAMQERQPKESTGASIPREELSTTMKLGVTCRSLSGRSDSLCNSIVAECPGMSGAVPEFYPTSK